VTGYIRKANAHLKMMDITPFEVRFIFKFIAPVAGRLKVRKTKQTIVHCTTNQ